MSGGVMIILRLYIFRTKWRNSSQRQPKLSTHWGQDSKSQSVKKCNHRLIHLLWIISWQLKMQLSSVHGPLVPVCTHNNVWACSRSGGGWCPSLPVPLVKCTDWGINLLVHIYMLGETAVGNQYKHRYNIQTPQRRPCLSGMQTQNCLDVEKVHLGWSVGFFKQLRLWHDLN